MRLHTYYILDKKGEPQKIDDLQEWALWFEKQKERVVKQETIGDCQVSTVFLGLDHNYRNTGPPVLWETVTFSNNKKLDQEQTRCSGSREQAEAMHQRMVELVKKKQHEGKNTTT